jgi:alcohol dehydrogenase class IV
MFGEMFSLSGIPKIMNAIHFAVTKDQRDESVHEELLYGASLAGVAISNVRTGSIHEAAGALLELTTLSHAETLFVFFRDAIEQYLTKISHLERSLIAQLRLLSEFENFRTMQDIISWWEMIFQKVCLDKKIRDAVKLIESDLENARRHVFNRVYSDKVWITKESPITLTENDVWNLVDNSLNRFGIKNNI